MEKRQQSGGGEFDFKCRTYKTTPITSYSSGKVIKKWRGFIAKP
jgi:hypothetical protein